MITPAGSATEVVKESIRLLSLRQHGVLMQALCKQILHADNPRAAAGGLLSPLSPLGVSSQVQHSPKACTELSDKDWEDRQGRSSPHTLVLALVNGEKQRKGKIAVAC